MNLSFETASKLVAAGIPVALQSGFEAYVPKHKRQLGYFTLPVLVGDEIVAALDLKADRQNGELMIQAWHWVGPGESARHRQAVEDALERFERFQFGD